jgi:hypothetical protein
MFYHHLSKDNLGTNLTFCFTMKMNRNQQQGACLVYMASLSLLSPGELHLSTVFFISGVLTCPAQLLS